MRWLREFFGGVGVCLRGFAWWGRHPREMAIGAIPGLLVGALMIAALIALGMNVVQFATVITPFADGWGGFGEAARTVLAVALFSGGVALAVLSYAAVTLTIGQPFYEQIAESVERELGGIPNRVEIPFWRGVVRGIRDGVKLLALAIGTGLIVFFFGLIPVLGTVVGWTIGAVLGGWVLAIELTGYPADSRGLNLAERRQLLAGRRARSLGFGITSYLLFLIPGGAVVGMPATTAAATLFVRELRGEPTKLPSAPA